MNKDKFDLVYADTGLDLLVYVDRHEAELAYAEYEKMGIKLIIKKYIKVNGKLHPREVKNFD